LIKRGHYPFEGMWALPGGFLDMEETLEQCAIRELEEETNIKISNIEQLITASKLGRDPRGRTVTTIFWAFVIFETNANAGDDAADAKWFNIFELPQIAFDHSEIIDYAIKQLKFRANLSPYFLEFF
jgi:ADP-ribose pyrophosphatase YjhB (NUDIX family)